VLGSARTPSAARPGETLVRACPRLTTSLEETRPIAYAFGERTSISLPFKALRHGRSRADTSATYERVRSHSLYRRERFPTFFIPLLLGTLSRRVMEK
jgi:hypothetical protein